MNLICIFKICLLHILLIYTEALSIEKCKTLNCQLSGNDLKKDLSADLTNQPIDNPHNLFNNHSKDHLKDKTETQLNDQPTIKATTEASESNALKSNVLSTVTTIKDSNDQLNRKASNAQHATEQSYHKGSKINLIDKSKHNDKHQTKQRSKREPRGGRIGGKFFVLKSLFSLV